MVSRGRHAERERTISQAVKTQRARLPNRTPSQCPALLDYVRFLIIRASLALMPAKRSSLSRSQSTVYPLDSHLRVFTNAQNDRANSVNLSSSQLAFMLL